MKRLNLILVTLFLITNICAAQDDLKTSIDYQYKREGDTYSAYSTFLNKEENAISLAIVSSYKIEELQRIKIKFGELFIDVPFSKLTSTLPNDDKAMNSLGVKLELNKLLQEKTDCELKIIFQLIDGTKIELPFMFCLLKEKLKI